MARDNKSASGKGAASNRAGKPTGSYSSYGPSGYGYSTSGTSYSRTTTTTTTTGKGTSGVPAKINTTTVSEKELKGKQKKLAKKAKKFDETDLRCYPMTIGGWIGTFILSCLFPINIIFFICWFFGVGNKSRTSWVRSFVVIFLVVVLLFGIIVGATYGVLNSKAKNFDVTIDGTSYGKAGDYGIKGIAYYVACGFVDVLGPDMAEQIIGMLGGGSGGSEGNEGNEGESEISSEDAITMVKAVLAQMILGVGGEETPDNGGTSSGGFGTGDEFGGQEE